MIDVQKNSARWTVILNRPDKANALSLEMLEALHQVYSEAAQDKDVRVLVITGAGDRVFCAGADLGQAKDATSITNNPIWEKVSLRLANLPCLTITALNGTLAGGGFGLALASDLRLSVPSAKFFYPVLKNGFLPQPSDVKRMIRLIGPAKTKLILLGGQKLQSDEALSIGLIDRIVERDDMEEAIIELSNSALSASPVTLAAIKSMIRPDFSALDLEDCYKAVYESDPDAFERIRT